jgi:hypothetical protein
MTAPGGWDWALSEFIVSSTTPAPRVGNWDPGWGPIGCRLKVTGHFFTGATSVKLSGLAMKFQVDSDEQITAVVPPRAMSGAISVTTQYGTGKVAQFNVIKPRPKLGTPISPRTAKPGVTFKVYGTLKPHFPAGSRTVRVRVWKYSGGHWSPVKWLSAVNSNSSSYSKYTAKVSLTRGKFRFQASCRETPTWGGNGSADSRAMTVK